jgi:uncharacterized membrane protein
MSKRKQISLYIMTAFYVISGIMHFVRPDTYNAIVPRWLPYSMEIVYISGIAEIICALLLLFPATMRLGAWLIILVLIAVFPANIQMAVNYYHNHNPYFWLSVLRLPFQILLIWWAWKFARKYPTHKKYPTYK